MYPISIELAILMPNGSRSARDIIELYSAQIVDDINQTAWNLCNCDDQTKDNKFSGLMLERWKVNRKSNDGYQVTASMKVSAESTEFANQVIEEYMDGFADWISETENGLYSRTGVRTGFNPHPVDWNAQVK